MRRRALLTTAGGALACAAVPRSVASVRAQSDGDSFEPLGRVAVPGAAEAVVGDDGETAYLAATTGFVTIDVSDPADPTVLAEERDLEVDGDPVTEILDVAVDGDRLAVVAPGNETLESVFQGALVYDVSDPGAPERVGEPAETGFHIHNCFLDGDALYLVENTPESNALVVYDLDDSPPTAVGRWSLLEHDPDWEDVYWFARYLHDVYVHDDVAYLPFWDAGTYLLDVSDPEDPTYVSHVGDADPEETLARDAREAQFGLPGNDHYAAVDETGDLLAVGREAWATEDDSGGPGGIDLYDASDPGQPDWLASIDPPRADDETYRGGQWTTAHNFELRDDRLYSAWYRGGVAVHDVSDPASPVERARWRDFETAAFWTARVAERGSTVVASSTPLVPNASTEGALYTFPADPDDTVTRDSTSDVGASDGAASTGGAGPDTRDGEPADGNATGSTAAGDGHSVDSLPGFTGFAGVAGGLAGLEWLRSRRE